MSLLDSFEAAENAEELNIFMPDPTPDGRVPTLNQNGVMALHCSDVAKRFMKIASIPGKKVLEVGPAYGEVCIQALKNGSTDYTLIDIEKKHLLIIAKRICEEISLDCLHRVKLLAGGFQDRKILTKLIPETYDAILIEQVFHFLHSDEIFPALNNLYKLLKPGGKIFATMSSPFEGWIYPEIQTQIEIEAQKFLKDPPTYLSSHTIPGFIPYTRSIVNESCVSKTFLDQLQLTYKHCFLFDKDVTNYMFKKMNFDLIKCDYVNYDQLPFKMDGKEVVEVEAVKN